ncbi:MULTISPECIES: hypothetical protein [Brasilonema]|nr:MULTISPECIES: hypothetical protein [Brasilonema]
MRKSAYPYSWLFYDQPAAYYPSEICLLVLVWVCIVDKSRGTFWRIRPMFYPVLEKPDARTERQCNTINKCGSGAQLSQQLAMEVLKFTAMIDESGYLSLNIPRQLAAQEVNIVVVLNPVSSSGKQKLNYDFSDLVGRLTWRGDALCMQRTLRDEW